MVKLTQQEFDSVPLQVVVEVLIAAVLCMWGAYAFRAIIHLPVRTSCMSWRTSVHPYKLLVTDSSVCTFRELTASWELQTDQRNS